MIRKFAFRTTALIALTLFFVVLGCMLYVSMAVRDGALRDRLVYSCIERGTDLDELADRAFVGAIQRWGGEPSNSTVWHTRGLVAQIGMRRWSKEYRLSLIAMNLKVTPLCKGRASTP